MTDVNFLSTYYTSVRDRLITAGFAVDKLFLVRSESELSGDIKNLPAGEFFMAVVIPGSDTRAMNIDNVKEHENWLVYALEKRDIKDETHPLRITNTANQQAVITAIKNMLRADMESRVIPCNIRPDLNSMHTDPEYRYMGCDGYSVSFKVESDDFITS